MEQEERLGQRAQEEIVQFVELYPEVKPGDVPQEVWAQVRKGMSLALAYSLWRLRTLEAAAGRRERAEELATGSVSSAGSGGLNGTLAAFWDAYQV